MATGQRHSSRAKWPQSAPFVAAAQLSSPLLDARLAAPTTLLLPLPCGGCSCACSSALVLLRPGVVLLPSHPQLWNEFVMGSAPYSDYYVAKKCLQVLPPPLASARPAP